MIARPVPEMSVLIAFTDARGDATEHLRTWTHGQTLPRDRYQLVVVSDGEEPSIDRDVASMLEQHDVFDVVPGGEAMELWQAAAVRASSPWLLVTENHCKAERDTLERALEGIQGSSELEGASLEQLHLSQTAAGELCANWSERVRKEWVMPGEWKRLSLAGFVIRRDAYHAAGGLESEYGLFATPLLAARLAERGARLGSLPDARVAHVHVDGVDEHHGHSANYAEGECEARPSLDPEFAERYFGHQHLVWNRRGLRPSPARRTTGVLLQEIAWAARRRRRDLPWLAKQLALTLPASVAGVWPRLLHARLAVAWSERAASLKRLSFSRRFGHVLRGQDRAVRRTHLLWIKNHPDGNGGSLVPGAHGIERLGEAAVIGVHGLERRDGRPFRWSEPVVTVRLDLSAGGGELRIDTGGLRGSPLPSLNGVYLGTRRLSPAHLREEGEVLVIELPPDGAGDLTLVCRPLTGAADPRRLGMPLFSLELRGVSSPETEASLPVPQPAG